MGEIVGRSFTAYTVRLNVARRLPLSALATVRVMRAVPNWLGAGVIFTVRLLPLPPNTMLALGTRTGFEEAPVTTKFAAAVAGSPTVKGSGPVEVSSLIARSARADITGSELDSA